MPVDSYHNLLPTGQEARQLEFVPLMHMSCLSLLMANIRLVFEEPSEKLVDFKIIAWIYNGRHI